MYYSCFLLSQSWSFDGTNWVTNGPLLLTDTAETFCSHQWIKWSDSDKFANYQCPGFEILPPENGCPIPGKGVENVTVNYGFVYLPLIITNVN